MQTRDEGQHLSTDWDGFVNVECCDGGEGRGGGRDKAPDDAEPCCACTSIGGTLTDEEKREMKSVLFLK